MRYFLNSRLWLRGKERYGVWERLQENKCKGTRRPMQRINKIKWIIEKKLVGRWQMQGLIIEVKVSAWERIWKRSRQNDWRYETPIKAQHISIYKKEKTYCREDKKRPSSSSTYFNKFSKALTKFLRNSYFSTSFLIKSYYSMTRKKKNSIKTRKKEEKCILPIFPFLLKKIDVNPF